MDDLGVPLFSETSISHPNKCVLSKDVRFRLWGLTLRATADALVLGDAPELSWPPVKFRFGSWSQGYKVTRWWFQIFFFHPYVGK